jgi:hypothetical protein
MRWLFFPPSGPTSELLFDASIFETGYLWLTNCPVKELFDCICQVKLCVVDE